MYRPLIRLLSRTLPGLLVAALWLAWGIIPERPLRTCPLDTTDHCFPVFRPANGRWAIIVPSNLGIPLEHDFVLRFDPVHGRAEKLPTPQRTLDVIAPDVSQWAWIDADGRVHVATLPDNRPLLTTPPDRRIPFRRFQISPGGRWLLVANETNERVDVWDVANGTKCVSLTDEVGGWYGNSCGFSSPDRVRVPWLDKTGLRVRATLYQLSSGSVVERTEVPCVKGQSGFCPANDSYLLLYGGPVGKETAWDISVSPPREMVNNPPYLIQVSPDGRCRVTTRAMRDDWEITNATTGEVISSSSDAIATNHQWGPLHPAFSADGRFLLCGRTRPGVTQPTWTPSWLVEWCREHGYGQDRYSVVLSDPATGRELRELPGGDVVYIAPHGDRIWLMPVLQAGSQKIVEEWPITPPRPPWWLWTVTAATIVWCARPIWRRRSQPPSRRPLLARAETREDAVD